MKKKAIVVLDKNAAVTQFLADLREYRETKSPTSRTRVNAANRLLELTEKKPEATLAYLNSLPEGVEERFELLRDLRDVATKAILKRANELFLKPNEAMGQSRKR